MVEKIWVVTDPTPISTLVDCVFDTTAKGFVLQVLGGLSPDQNPEVHATRADALADLDERLRRTSDKLDALRLEIMSQSIPTAVLKARSRGEMHPNDPEWGA